MAKQLSRLYFLARGYHKHPRYDLWAHKGCSFFVNSYGLKLAHSYSPSARTRPKGRGYIAPSMRRYGSKNCHILMAEIFYGERPVFHYRNGKPYVGQCHHLINDPLNYCPENLLCWLTRPEHDEADRRRRALESVVPDGNLTLFDNRQLRHLQDPRVCSREEFDETLERLRQRHFQISRPLDLDREDMRHAEY